MSQSTIKPVALNPNAPEFKPKRPVLQEISLPVPQKHRCLYPPNGFKNQFPRYPNQIWKPAKTLNGKPENPIQPYRFRFLNQKCLPPRLLKKKVCDHKNRNLPPTKLVPPPEEVKLESLLADKTSVMIRNIPNNFRRSDLLRILDAHCLRENKKEVDEQETRSSYDFLYLPMDFVYHANLGYAFVNFTSSLAAEKFRRDFDNFFWTTLGNKKYCQITLAKFQGKEMLSNHFKDSKFPCHTDDYLPVILSPPSDGFNGYSLKTLGHRITHVSGGARRSQIA